MFDNLVDIIDKDRSIADKIPFSHHAEDQVIVTRQGDYLTTIKLVGRTHLAADIADMNKWVQDLNTLIRSIPAEDSDHIAFWTHIDRRREKINFHKNFDNKFSQDLTDKYIDIFGKKNLMVNDLYVTICYRPIIDKTSGFFSRFEKPKLEERLEQQEAYVQKLNDITNLLLTGLRAYEPIRLGVYEHKGRMYCQALEFYAYLLTHQRTRVPVTRERYYNYLSNNRILFSNHGEIGEIRQIERSKFFGMLELKEYENYTVPGHINTLLNSNCELIVAQSFKVVSKVASQGFLKRHKKFMVDSADLAVSQIEQIDQALDDLTSGAFVMGEHHMTVCVYDDSPSRVKEHLQAISADLGEVGIVPSFLDLALESGFFAQLPNNYEHRPRPAPITSLNFLSLNSFHNFMNGKAYNNPWGEAVSMFQSTSGTPYFFNFHNSPKYENSFAKKYDGNTLIFGKTGSGKTTLANFLLSQFLSVPGLRVVAFDKDRGLEAFIRAVGGKYLPLETGKPTGFNPLQLNDTPNNRKFIKNWLHNLLAYDGYGVNYRDEQELIAAIDIIFMHEQENRKLSVFVQSLPNPITDDERPTVNQRLAKWHGSGEYAWVFDNVEDSLDVNKYSVYGFDVTNFLELPELREVIIMYLTYRTQQMLDGRPFVYFFDEYWRLAQDKYFQKLFEDKLKTIRKENGICIFASQEPNDALRSEIAKTMVSQCATQILLENPKADYEDYVAGLKLTPEEYEMVVNIPEKSYQFLVKQGGQSALLQFNLRGFEKEITVLSGTPENAEKINDIMSRIGSEHPDDWLPLFYEENGFTNRIVA